MERIEETGVGHNSGFVSLLDRSRRSSAQPWLTGDCCYYQD